MCEVKLDFPTLIRNFYLYESGVPAFSLLAPETANVIYPLITKYKE